MIWKAIVTSFDLIENHLAWDVGNGESVMIGRDPWMGSFQQHLLPPDVIDQLGLQGVIMLNQLAVPRINEPWIQIWKRAVSFELGARETVILDHYIRELVRANIILSDQEDTLVWEVDPGGVYSPKAGYLALCTGLTQRVAVWWWKPLWKLKCPAKTKLFMWCILYNKASTWDVLQKRSFQGPGWCVLCKKELESSMHLFLTCPYILDVWKEVSILIGFNCQWEGETVGDAWLSWWRSTNLTQRKLPLLVLWGVWLARNQAIFKDVFCSPALTGTLSVGIYNSFPEQIRAGRPRRIISLHIDKTLPRSFFYGAAQNNLCGGGAVLFLTDSHYFAMSLGLGGGTNNFAELMSPKFLLMFALETGCTALNFYGDSMNVIQWINHTQECWNLRLAHIISNIRQLLLRFDSFSC